MTDDPGELFRGRARWLLGRGLARLPAAELDACRADPGRVAAAPLATLLALAAANALADDADFDLMLATEAALDRVDWANELLRAHPPPAHFDADADDAPAIKVVVHPEHGVGLVELDPADERGWIARVCFVDGERRFRGDAARWEHPRRTFAAAAALRLVGLPDADEPAFWSQVAAIDWGGGRPIPALAAELAARVPLVACVALHNRLHRLGHDLRAALEAWEAASGAHLPCGDDSFGDLTDHIVGLGRDVYRATLADPGLALRRAEARDYRESFAYVFQRAEHLYDVAEIAAALREHAADALVDDPVHGPGVRHEGAVVFPDRVVRLEPLA